VRRCIVVGAGGRGGYWVHRVLPEMRDQVQVVGLVDIEREPMEQGAQAHDLSPSQLFSDANEAFESIEADFCLISTPPWVHEQNVSAAVEHGVAILSEKPIADTLEASVRIKKMVQSAGLPMTVVQNYRYSPYMLAFRDLLRSGELGRLSYLIGRFAACYNPPRNWGRRFRHDMDYALLIEGSVHHFDMLRNLAGADCEEIFGYGWIPPWADFRGDCNGLYVMNMTNDSRAFYEGSCTTEGYENSWHKEYYRAECERGAVVVDADNVVKIHRIDDEEPQTVEQPADAPEEGQAIVNEFLAYLQTGEPSPTAIADNTKSVGMVFAAIECDRTGRPVKVQEMLDEAEANVEV